MGVLIAHPRSGGRRRQQGMALIIVLMLFAILAAVEVYLIGEPPRSPPCPSVSAKARDSVTVAAGSAGSSSALGGRCIEI